MRRRDIKTLDDPVEIFFAVDRALRLYRRHVKHIEDLCIDLIVQIVRERISHLDPSMRKETINNMIADLRRRRLEGKK